MSFYFCAISRNAQNLSLKNDVINVYGSWANVFQKWMHQPHILHARCPEMVLQHIVRFLEIMKILNFELEI